MKKIYFFTVGILLFAANISTAQIAETNDIQPQTPESKVATSEELPFIAARYYYYPNLDAYFDSQEGLFIYDQQGEWIKTKQIPSGYRGYSIYNGMNFAINDYNGDKPYTKLSDHRKQFPKKYSSRRQPPKVTTTDAKVAYN
ncbi:MAG TPA: hypothetical protein VK623_03345 [Flavobacterium sp.]|nr:hypothetical protein [Flavobacterium sp.]